MTASFRARILLLVLAVAVLPLGLIGLWLTGSAARSGEALLRSRLESALDADARAVELSWLRYRSALLDLSEAPELQGALRAPAGATSRGAPTRVQAGFASLEPAVEGMIIRDRAGRELWRLGRLQADPGGFLAFGALLSADVPLFDVATGEPLGRIEAFVPINALRPASATAAAIGAVITARDPVTGALLLPAPFDPSLLAQERFQWNAEDWMVVRRSVSEPSVELIATAPVAPFAAPFRGSARRGSLVLLIVAAFGLWTAVLITARLTRSLEDLAAAAGDVAGGHLGRRVDVRSDDEIGRVARAFNAMTDSLRRTLDQLAERESLAAVNEFAAALAHEVRNPLTAIRLDLQEVEERLPRDSPLRALQSRALEDVLRLDRTVAGALETARTGHIEPRHMDLREPVRAAVRAAGPAFDARGAVLSWEEPPEEATVRGDPDALEHVFLNLLLNAAAAVEAHGRATVSLHRGDRDYTVAVHDSGHGVPAEARERVFEPFFTTRPGGTGVGLAVARRIVLAHRGEITLLSEPGHGTTAEVRLPIGTP
ncbi:MAG TPA: ATP-binding protein [Gemmatimonadales bacterium]